MSKKKEKKVKAEEVAEKTGEVVGKGLKKGWGIVKGSGRRFEKRVRKRRERRIVIG